MIIEFSLGNYRSFNEVQTLSFRATGLTSEDKAIDENNIAVVGGQRLLKTVGVYGANASGKSNLLKGFQFFKKMVKFSLSDEYLLQQSYSTNNYATLISGNEESFFQVILYLQGKKYRYGFTVNKHSIVSEWLFGQANSNETYYFTRKGREIKVNKEYFPEGNEMPYATKLRQDSLFLSFCSAFNGEISGNIRSFISHDVLFSGYENDTQITNGLIRAKRKQVVLEWLRKADLVYDDVLLNDAQDLNTNDNNAVEQISMIKKIENPDTTFVERVALNLLKDESDGTRKYYSLIGIVDAIFEFGGLFISDEIDSNFHPALLIKIIGMFNNPAINKANAQLLFTSHDTNLMNPEIMRRDQFYFTEKSATDATVLYSLADLKGIRNNADFAKQYLAGYYGALPMLNTFTEPENNH